MQFHDTTTHPSSEIPYGYCHCGCGQKTKLATRIHKRLGYIVGEPLRFVNRHSHAKPLEQRFWAKVDKNGPVPDHRPELGACWIWIGSKTSNGYGKISAYRRLDMSHRVSWRLHFEPIPPGMNVLHSCDNPACLRPDHLFLGTTLDNVRDRIQKNRTVKGSAKLTEEAVREIRDKYRSTKVSMAQLGKQYGVSPATICLAITRQTWNNVA